MFALAHSAHLAAVALQDALGALSSGEARLAELLEKAAIALVVATLDNDVAYAAALLALPSINVNLRVNRVSVDLAHDVAIRDGPLPGPRHPR